MPHLRKVLGCLLFLLSYSSFLQSTRIAIQLFEEGKPQTFHKPFKIQIISQDTSVAESDNMSFLLPDSIRGHEYTIVLVQSKYKLVFDNIIVGWNDELPLWKVNVDYAPIDKENAWSIPKEKLGKTRWLYTLERGNGTVLTWYRFGKPFK